MHPILEKNFKKLLEKNEKDLNIYIENSEKEQINLYNQKREIQKKIYLLKEELFAKDVLDVCKIYKDKIKYISFEFDYDSDDEGGVTKNLRPKVSLFDDDDDNLKYEISDIFYGYGDEIGEITIDFQELTAIYEKTKLNQDILIEKENNNNNINKI